MELKVQLQETLGHTYTIERELGGGGMSRVFLATEQSLGRSVVVKVLPSETAGALSMERFRREIQLAATLQQANIVPVLNAGEVDGVPFYTMPYVEGDSLRARLTAGGPVSISDAVGLLKEIARALAHAHQRGIVHRDIKPDNVLLSGGSAMVTDFGIAKALSNATTAGDGALTRTGVTLGTPLYMAPEQAVGDPAIDHRVDIYAFGCLAYELLTGVPPFAGSPQAVIAAHLTATPEPIARKRAGVPTALAGLVARCLEKRPDNRPQSAMELIAALERVAGAPAPVVPTLARRRRGPLALVAALIVIGFLALAAMRMMRSGAGDTPKSIAVLPFENSGGDSTQEYFSDGMTDDIATALVNDGLRVAPRASSYYYKGKHPSAQDVGRTLGVDAVLTGTVSRLGSRLHLVAEVTSAQDGLSMASYSDTRQTSDLFAVQHAIEDSIVSVLRARLRDAQGPRGPRAPAHVLNLEAHDLAMQARFFYNQSTPGALHKAIDLFHTALAKDSSDASAWAGLAWTWLAFGDANAPPSDVIENAKTASDRALWLDSLNAEAWSVRANIAGQWMHDWPTARTAAARALAINQNDPNAHLVQAVIAIAGGNREAAIGEARIASRLDPLNSFTQWLTAYVSLFVGRPDSAIAQMRVVDQLLPGFAYIDALDGFALADLGHFYEAERAFKKAEPTLGHRSPGLAWLYAQHGRALEARAILIEIERDWKTRYVPPEFIAMAYVALGDTTRALDWLERGVDVMSAPAAADGMAPQLRPLRNAPRFQALLRQAHVTAAFAP